MKTTHVMLGGLLAAMMMLGGCASKTVSQSEHSGFLSSYDGLTKTQTASGNTVMRWVDPNFNVANYDKVIFQPVSFYPTPLPSDRLSQETLNDLLNYTNTRLSGALSKRLQLASPNSGARTLVFRGAITGVGAATQGLKPYEVIPVALLVAGAMTAAGKRDQNTELYLEGELVDSATGQPVLRVVRKGMGKTLSNDKQAVTADDLRSVIDDLTQDVLSFK
ncbi:DUF3313 domain-containing protein [Pseudomonas sp. sp1636]|uniref:DUF3313 domain-containing protein n=1 Tax=Pseudomonas sp. sp1636 TaxID=3036707 RepID=UPI0025A68ECC|nr:DUF3313 domain-containing protein [Pseudomonas sp. sp1636]MDM8348182.1 DUF3313 domain-containing protein [Pseudomonas sp. sp1636]